MENKEQKYMVKLSEPNRVGEPMFLKWDLMFGVGVRPKGQATEFTLEQARDVAEMFFEDVSSLNTWGGYSIVGCAE